MLSSAKLNANGFTFNVATFGIDNDSRNRLCQSEKPYIGKYHLSLRVVRQVLDVRRLVMPLQVGGCEWWIDFELVSAHDQVL